MENIVIQGDPFETLHTQAELHMGTKQVLWLTKQVVGCSTLKYQQRFVTCGNGSPHTTCGWQESGGVLDWREVVHKAVPGARGPKEWWNSGDRKTAAACQMCGGMRICATNTRSSATFAAEETVFLVGSDGVVGKIAKMVKMSGLGTLHVVLCIVVSTAQKTRVRRVSGLFDKCRPLVEHKVASAGGVGGTSVVPEAGSLSGAAPTVSWSPKQVLGMKTRMCARDMCRRSVSAIPG